MITQITDGESDLKKLLKMYDPVEKIKAWRLVDDMAVEAFHLTSSFPEDVLSKQIREVAASCGSHIAESANHRGSAEYINGLKRSQALMMQLRYLIYLSRRLLLIDQKRYARAIKKHEMASRAVQELIQLSENKNE